MDPVDVARRQESRHVAGERDRRAGLDEVAVAGEAVAGLVLGAFVDADDTPREVVMDGRGLTGQPDERHQGEGAVGCDVQQV